MRNILHETFELCATIRLVDKSLRVLRLQVALLNQKLDVTQLSGKELCSETRLTEPRGNGSSYNRQRLDNTIHVVVVGKIGSIRVCGQI